MTPTNDIERLLESPTFGKHNYPEIFRLLRESDLIFLLHNTTGSKGVLPWVDIGQVPEFAVWGSVRSGMKIPIFSSHEAARSACREIGVWNKFSFRQINGRKLFELLAQQEESFAINPVCSEYAMHLDVSHAEELADGSILKPRKNDTVSGTL
ncbi:MAG: hypothetical protein JWM68_744, partial [Verrucomicrobiales bacterium]|nr:hypothetical protein [Verrucomicrobiales bacterium]